MIIQYIVLLLPLIAHLVVDYKGKVHHANNAIGVTVLSMIVGLLLPGYFWQGALYALSIHFTFFDPIYNLMHGHSLFYHGNINNPERAKTDKMWDYLNPIAEIFTRLWALGVGFSVYHKLPQIIGYIPILFAIVLFGCGANHHVRKAEYHIAKAESKGATWKQSEKADTIYRDTTIVVEGNSMDESFGFIDKDTVTIEKEKIIVKTVIDCKKKTANTKVDCPDKIVKVHQKYYINRRITRTLKTGLSNLQIGGFCLMFLFIGFTIGKLLPSRRSKPL